MRLLLILPVYLFVFTHTDPSFEESKKQDDPEYQLVWSDEFDTNGAPDPDKWHHQTFAPANGSWFNGEEQHYTDRLDNSIVEDGSLKIIAKRETFNNGQSTKEYTSARLNSKFAFTYGKVDVRAKLPEGRGTWPAIWTLGRNINEVGGYWQTQGFGATNWPATGEIDIMEHWGDSPDIIHWSNHTPAGFGGNPNTSKGTISNVSNEFHVYSIEWNEEEIKYLVDEEVYHVYNPVNKDLNNWPFDDPQYLLLNVAMGGIFQSEPRSIDPAFTESAMEIDYVRIYQVDNPPLRDASLTDIIVNGVSLNEFSPDKLDYTYALEGGVSIVPEVRFTKSNVDATVVVFNANGVPGITTLQVTAANGVTSQDYTVEFLIEETILGVHDEKIFVYPNPSTSTMNLKLSEKLLGMDELTFRFIDLSGIEHPVNVKQARTELTADISRLPKGVYVLQIRSTNLKMDTRFVVK